MSGSTLRGSRRILPSRLCVATALCLYGASLFAGPSTLSSSAQDDHVLLPSGVYAGNEAGLRLVHDYGALQLWQVDATHRLELAATAQHASALQGKAVLFDAGDFDPTLTQNIPAAFGAYKGNGPQVHILQLNGPTTDALMDTIAASGALVVAPLSGNAYALLADDATASRLVSAVEGEPLLRAVSALPSFYKLSGGLSERARLGLSPGNELDITVQIAKHPASRASKQAIEALDRGGNALVWDNRLSKESLQLRVSETDLATIANLPDVFAVEPRFPRRKYDEVQAQILAGNFNGNRSGPSGIGYRGWLQSKGFSTNPADYPIIDVVDDGMGTGVAATGGGDVTFTRNGDGTTSRVASIFNCTSGSTPGTGGGGHGHLNANVVGGYDARGDAGGIQTPFEDPQGYLRGQGINPYTRLAATKIFTDAGSFVIGNCGGTDAGLIKSSQDRGAPITTNSWGAPVGGNYDDSSEAYDIGTRDGDLTEAGNQPMIHIFAAGNDGSGAATIGSPGSGKNMITVGASENARPGPDETGAWTDACGIGASGANDARDIIGFSSRGPAEGTRTKPEIIAPGTHIQGTASTASNYNGSGVCDQYRPTNQTVFAASSGTSHSTPAVAGIASLAYRWMQTEYGITAPSAALMKAWLMSFPTYLTGVGANDNLPSNNQGYGMPNMGAAFDATTLNVLVDQTHVFGATGQTYTLSGGVADPAKPVRISLAWSDAPGAISDTTPQVNNLDLSVTVGGVTYTGNRFTGQYSTAGGGAPDTANNYEAVFLPAGTTGNIVVTVTATGIVGDGIPNNADTTDQDFALVCTNCAQTPDFFVNAEPAALQTCGVDTAAWDVAVGSYNGYVGNVTLSHSGLPAGATATILPPSGAAPFDADFTVATTAGLASGTYPLTINGNDGTNTRSDQVLLQHSSALAGGATLLTPSNGASNVATTPSFTWNAVPGAIDYTLQVDDNPAFTSIDYSATVTGTSHVPTTNLSGATTYHWRVIANNNCGAGAPSASRSFTTLPLFCATPNVAIPDNNTTGVTSTITVSAAAGGAIQDLDLRLRANHTWVGDLVVTLRHVPTNTLRTPMDRPGVPATTNGCNGDNVDIIIDDEGTNGSVENNCLNATPAYTIGGRYTPNAPLTAFDGVDLTGVWELNISDRVGQDTGTLLEWCLVPTVESSTVQAVADAYDGTEDTTLTVAAPGVLANDTSQTGTLTAVLDTDVENGALTLNADGSFSYVPEADFCGEDSFLYHATNGTESSNPVAVTLDIACANDLPVAVADAYTADEDQALTVAAAQGVLANDTDADGDALTAVLGTGVSNGTLALNADGSFTYTPNADYCGNDSFTYFANDGTANSASAATVSLTVTCDPTEVADDNYSGTENTPLVVAAPGVLANDSSDIGGTLTAVVETTPTNGTLVLNSDGGFTYTPNVQWCGNDSFTYRATDGSNTSVPATVTLAIACTNDAPVAVDDAYTVTEGTNLVVPAPGVLGNDTDGDGDLLTAAIVTQPTKGTAALAASGALLYVPNAGACGIDTFTYTANDATSSSAPAIVTLTIECENQPPVAGTIADATFPVGTTIELDAGAGFSDPEDEALTFSATGLPASLTIDPATGTIAGTATEAGSYEVTVTAEDPTGQTASATFTLTIAAVSIFADGFED